MVPVSAMFEGSVRVTCEVSCLDCSVAAEALDVSTYWPVGAACDAGADVCGPARGGAR